MSRDFKIAMLLLTVTGVAVLLLPVTSVTYDGKDFSLNQTKASLNELALASQAYFLEYEEWPTSTDDLTNNQRGVIFVNAPRDHGWQDGWGRDIQYIPFDLKREYGVVISLGKDGKKGGTGTDSDLEFRFQSPITK